MSVDQEFGHEGHDGRHIEGLILFVITDCSGFLEARTLLPRERKVEYYQPLSSIRINTSNSN